MKGSKIWMVLALILACFAGFLAGLFVGRTSGRETLYFERADQVQTLPVSREITEQPETPSEAGPSETAPAADGRVDINSATQAELQRLPGIGEVIAGRIVAYREANGPFRSVEELTDVEGIGDKRMDEIRDLITVR